MKPVIILGDNGLKVTHALRAHNISATFLLQAEMARKYLTGYVAVIACEHYYSLANHVIKLRLLNFTERIVVIINGEISATELARLYDGGIDTHIRSEHLDVVLPVVLKSFGSTERPRHSPVSELMMGNLVFDLEYNNVRADTTRIHLPPKLYFVLLKLVKCHDHAVSRQQLIDEVWDGAEINDRTVDTAVKRLRAYLTDAGATGFTIYTDYGFGYRLATS